MGGARSTRARLRLIEPPPWGGEKCAWGRHGQVQLSVPHGDEWLLDEVCGPVLRHVPTDFDLVMAGGEDDAATSSHGTRGEAPSAKAA